MDEVDKIILQGLTSIGCDVPGEVVRIGQLSQELFVESVAKLLNSINPGSEALPTKLPPNTAVKFRVCSRFATACQQLGYKNEIGYQTFLYMNEVEMRRILMFLVEKMNKEIGSSTSTNEPIQTSKKFNIKHLIVQEIKNSLNQFWIPPYCKLNSLRITENNQFIKEGCKFINNLNTNSLSLPKNYFASKSKLSKEFQNYYEKHCLYVTDQTNKRAVDVLTSLIQMNTIERLKENTLFKDANQQSKKEAKKTIALNELKESIRNSLKKANELSTQSSETDASKITYADLAEIENSIQSVAKNTNNKGSRFTYSEKLQFTKEETIQTASISIGSSEEKKEEEIKKLKEKLEEMNKMVEKLELEIKNLNEMIVQTEQVIIEQTELNKKTEENISIKQKTVSLINDAPMNIKKLQEEIGNHDDKMQKLEATWNAHKTPKEAQIKILKETIEDKKNQMQKKIDEIKSIRDEIQELNIELTEKENMIKELNQDYEKLQAENSKTSNRQFYNKRILEIVANIDRQKKEIDKILIETKGLQKEINQLTGKLERVFNTTDELIFKDAKKDEMNKKVYRLFVSINENYEQLIKTIEESSHLQRDIRDLEDQITTETQNKIADNLEMVMKDLKQIKEENEQLVAKNKSSKK